MNISTVNELIASLESAGELSIREQKFLKLAKEFRICSASLDTAIKTGNVLADQNAQLAAENVALKMVPETGSGEMLLALYSFRSGSLPDVGLQKAFESLMHHRKTPVTDRIVAGIKADGVEQAAKECYGAGYIYETLLAYAKQLREGADK